MRRFETGGRSGSARVLTIVCTACVALAAPTTAQEADGWTLESHGLVQVWFVSGDLPATFRVRRAEMKFGGNANEHVSWTVMLDPARAPSVRNEGDADGGTVSNGSILQDAFVTYRTQRVTVDVGQFKIPLGREGLQSSGTLETAERSLLASAAGKLTDLRDIGIRVGATASRMVGMQAGIFNALGETANSTDSDDAKAMVGRMTLSIPFIEGLTLGASGAWEPAQDGLNSTRVGADLLFESNALTIRGESLSARDATSRRRGYYTLAAYRPIPRLELACRYDAWHPGGIEAIDTAALRERDYIAGLSYMLDGHAAEVQATWMHKTFPQSDEPARNIVILNAQVSW